MRIGFIGGGVMAEALVKSLLAKGTVKPAEIIVSDISQQRRKLLARTYKVDTLDDNLAAIKNADAVVLAVKPQDLEKVMARLKNKFKVGQLVLSIIAGASLDSLQAGLNHPYIVRSMPNMPAQIGAGITVWTGTAKLTAAQSKMAVTMLAALGEEIHVSNEKYIDMATAISGSGPAYFFLIIEALTDAGVHIGLTRSIAEKLAVVTMIGSARTIQLTGKHPAELRNLVTSPGGTTTEGLLQLESGGLRSLILKAVIAAYEKAKMLAK